MYGVDKALERNAMASPETEKTFRNNEVSVLNWCL